MDIESKRNEIKDKFKAAWEASKHGTWLGIIDTALTSIYEPELITDEVAAKCTYGNNRKNLTKIMGINEGKERRDEIRKRVWLELRKADYSVIFREGAEDFFTICHEKYPESRLCIWTEHQTGRRLEQLAKIGALPIGGEMLRVTNGKDNFEGIEVAAIEAKDDKGKLDWIIERIADKQDKKILIIDDRTKVIEGVVNALKIREIEIPGLSFVHLLQGRDHKVIENGVNLENLMDLVKELEEGKLGKADYIFMDLDNTLTDDDKRIELQAEVFERVFSSFI